MNGKTKAAKEISLIETHMTMGESTSFFAMTRETYLRLISDLKTLPKTPYMLLQDALLSQNLERLRWRRQRRDKHRRVRLHTHKVISLNNNPVSSSLVLTSALSSTISLTKHYFSEKRQVKG